MNKSQPKNQPHIYEIRIEGHLANRWSGRFSGLTITLANDGTTLLCGEVIDQAALYGHLRKVRDLNMPLISVIRKKVDKSNQTEK